MSRCINGVPTMMGSLQHPPVADIALLLKRIYAIDTLIETGTFVGTNALWAAGIFQRVITIEINPEFQAIALERCGIHNNISFCLGDSRAILPSLVRGLTVPTMFWLDAHPIIRKDGVVFSDHGMPLMDELDAIRASSLHHVVLIDDAHLADAQAVQASADGGGYRMAHVDDIFIWTPLVSAIAA